MIVPTMTHAEAYRELDKDRENFIRWTAHMADSNRRRALKTTKFPALWWREYRSPRNNYYLINIAVTKRKYDDNHALSILALRREARGWTAYLTDVHRESNVKRIAYVQHVFDRYAERMGVEKQGIELIKHMFNNMIDGVVVDDPHLAGRSVRYNGRDHQFIAISDGVLLGDVEDGIFIARTFITYEMATGVQRRKFEHAQSGLNTLEEEVSHVQRVKTIPAIKMEVKIKNRVRSNF